MLPQAHGNDAIAGIFGKPCFDFRNSAAILSAILTVTTANTAPGHPYRSHVVLLSRHEAHKHHGNSKVARATAKERSTPVVADAGRLPEIAGKEVEKP